MADALSARQQIVDKIKDTSNILVTVSRNPSVDELSAALGLTLMLNKLKKHATAVVSGDIPPAITFLDPEKTFENTVDSLRDFIIALDKEKADHLRYKVDGDVVKIFITPYRTTIGQDDLEFSQGDYNVELVLALNVNDESHLDAALEAHGKILHDATVATIANSYDSSSLGSIDWRDENASSVSEMLVSLSEAIKGDKTLLDEQISTALLTGIVASTDRFSNEKTSSKVMTMAAQLMAAGANQQLIAAKLQEANAISEEKDEDEPHENSDGTTSLTEDTSTKVDKSDKKEAESEKPVEEPVKEEGADGSLVISHEKQGDLDEVAKQVSEEELKAAEEKAKDALAEVAEEKAKENTDEAAREAERKLAEELQATIPTASSEPLLGGTLNATSEQAAEDKRREEESDRNKTILTHGELGRVEGMPSTSAPFNAVASHQDDEPPTVDVFAAPLVPTPVDQPAEPRISTIAPDVTPLNNIPAPSQNQTLADLDAAARTSQASAMSQEDPLAAVHAAFEAPSAAPAPAATPAPSPDFMNLPPLPDMSTLPPPPPPLPDLPPLPGADPSLSQPQAPIAPPPVPSNDPTQFKIPGQS